MIFGISNGDIFNSCYANSSALFDNNRASAVVDSMFALTIDAPRGFFLHAARIICIAMSTFVAV